MIQFRRLAALIVGAWLGAGILADVAVIQNFETVDRFLEAPGSISTSAALNKVGRAEERKILRRNAGEENNWIFENWERTELALSAILFFILLFGERPQKLMLGLCLALFAIVLAQHFFLSPRIGEMGRRIDDLTPNDPAVAKFWKLHGFYSGLEIFKDVLTLALAVRLSIRLKPDKEHFAREFESTTGTKKSGKGDVVRQGTVKQRG